MKFYYIGCKPNLMKEKIMKVKKGDQIIVTVGKDRGRKGKIEKIFPKLNRVLVPGVNVYKRHLKSRSEKKPGGIVDIVKPLPVSNVALVCPKCAQPTRVGYRKDQKSLSKKATGQKNRTVNKYRICRKCQSII